jgi:hypothetical protein
MKGKVTVRMTEEDATRLEQAYKDGKLEGLGIESIEFPTAESKQWADPSLGKRGNLKGDDTGPKRP